MRWPKTKIKQFLRFDAFSGEIRFGHDTQCDQIWPNIATFDSLLYNVVRAYFGIR